MKVNAAASTAVTSTAITMEGSMIFLSQADSIGITVPSRVFGQRQRKEDRRGYAAKGRKTMRTFIFHDGWRRFKPCGKVRAASANGFRSAADRKGPAENGRGKIQLAHGPRGMSPSR